MLTPKIRGNNDTKMVLFDNVVLNIQDYASR